MRFLILLAAGACAHAANFDVRQYGATGDGHTKDTASIQKAIDACAQSGGGTVHVPPGRYFIGTIHLRSNVALDIEAGATLLGSTEPDDYPLVPSAWKEGAQEIGSLIRGENLTNIALTGRGTIDARARHGGSASACCGRRAKIRPRPPRQTAVKSPRSRTAGRI